MNPWHTRLAAADRALAEGRWAEAVSTYRLAMGVFPEHAVLRHALALALEGSGDLAAAVETALQAAALDPDDDITRFDLARMQWRQHKPHLAWQTLEPMLRQPSAETCHLAGLIAAARGDAAAHDWLARATRLAPHHPTYWLDLGNWHFERHDWPAARRCYQALADDAQCQFNLGRLAEQLQDWTTAIGHYRQALARSPNLAEAHWNLSLLLLRQGEYLAAWPHFAQRWERAALAQVPTPGLPRWQGEPLAGRTLLVWAEQGFGDSLQFLRFISWVEGRVVLRCQPELARLLAAQPGIELETANTHADVQCALLDLPGVLQVDLPTIGARAQPYLQPATSGTWPLPAAPRLGLVWAGRPTHAQDQQRSLALAHLHPLANLSVHWVSLQHGAAADEVKNWPGEISALGEQLTDFADTADMLSQLDGLVTVDTAVAHLAGAMGLPVWLLLCRRGEWRWQDQGERSPWYPSLTLLRQTKDGDWGGPVAALSNLLNARLQGS